MKIDVTQEHINNGVKSICNRCPIALAINGHLSIGFESMVDLWGIGIFPKRSEKSIIKFKTPFLARHFIFNFDKAEEVKPFSFNLSAECFMF